MASTTSSGPEDPRLTWTLAVPTALDAWRIASWATSAAETAMWVSRSDHPLPASAVLEWWQDEDVHPRILLDPDRTPVAYGEVWDDEEEDEVELARLIVDPAKRRRGIGRRLVDHLIDAAQATGRSECFLRVRPDNANARSLYRATGFIEVDASLEATWNAGQPIAYVWMQHPSVG